MAKIAMKFGGTSVADLDRIRHVAALVKRELDRGNQVAVVVSAMAGETNKLVGWTNEIAKSPGSNVPAIPDPREYDVWWRPASRSRPDCWPSRWARSAFRRVPGWAGRSRSARRPCTAPPASKASTPT